MLYIIYIIVCTLTTAIFVAPCTQASLSPALSKSCGKQGGLIWFGKTWRRFIKHTELLSYFPNRIIKRSCDYRHSPHPPPPYPLQSTLLTFRFHWNSRPLPAWESWVFRWSRLTLNKYLIYCCVLFLLFLTGLTHFQSPKVINHTAAVLSFQQLNDLMFWNDHHERSGVVDFGITVNVIDRYIHSLLFILELLFI